LVNDDFVRLDLAIAAVVFAAAEFPLDLHVRALGDVADRAGQLAPRCDAVPFRELLAGFAFAAEPAGS
jgi:hypothetical protein